MIWLQRSVFILSLIWSSELGGQSYLFALPDDPETFNRRISRFNNNDILISDSSDKGVTTESDGKVFLTRIDNCGNIVWSNSYERSTEYLEFKDAVIDDNGLIFAYGSAYRGGQEMLFLLKVASDGRLLDFKLIQTGTVDHFSYAMDIQDGVIMLYGLLLDFNTQKQGFISIFDEGLQHQWGKRFAPFESEGDAIIDSRGRFVCRSGPFHYVFDAEGNLIWGKEVDLNGGPLPIAGPIEVPGGFVFQAYREHEIFFYKIDFDGSLIWKSDRIPSERFNADFLVDGGSIIATYKTPRNGKSVIGRIDLDGTTGQILKHEFLDLPYSLDFEHIYTSLDGYGNYRILGNKVLREKYPIDIPYFLFQFPLSGEASDQCFKWNALNVRMNNSMPLVLNDIDTIIPDTRMQVLNTEGLTTVRNYDFSMVDVCGLKIEADTNQIDTILNCEEVWSISLPGDEFIWEDAPTLSERVINQSGTYIARNRDCLEPKVMKYILSKPDCTCRVYLPNAISANGDGVNDVFELYSDCQIRSYKLTVFNRWGVKVYEGKEGWSGSNDFGQFEQGVYIAQIEYELVDANGLVQVGVEIQQISLIR